VTIQITGAAIATSAHASGNTNTRAPVSIHRRDSSIDWGAEDGRRAAATYVADSGAFTTWAGGLDL
jgi:hypothetical protein